MRQGLLFSIIVSIVFCAPVLAYDWSTNPGDGSEANPYQISTPEQLMSIGSNEVLLTKHYILTSDIVFDPENNPAHVFDKALIAPDIDKNKGFQGNTFCGSFDGAGYKIWNFSINSQEDYLGLFGSIGASAEVCNTGVENCLFICRQSDIYIGSNEYVGALTGQNDSTNISNCYITGTIKGGPYTSVVGGLIGKNNGKITHCFAKAIIIGGNGIASFVSNNSGTIENCYSTGEVFGSNANAAYVATNSGIISNCYSKAKAYMLNHYAGFVNYSSEGLVESCYFLDIAGPDNGYGIPLSALQLENRSSFIDWDFNNINGWKMPHYNSPVLHWEKLINVPDVLGMLEENAVRVIFDAGLRYQVNYQFSGNVPAGKIITQYPKGNGECGSIHSVQLVVSEGPGFSGGEGTSESPYKLSKVEDFLDIAENSIYYSKHFVLVNDIDMSGYAFSESIFAPYKVYSAGEFFTGIFHGNRHKLLNLNISGTHFVGLFGLIGFGGEVSDIVLENCFIRGNSNTGSIAGFTNNGIISSCHSNGFVGAIKSGYGTSYKGGLVGQSFFGHIRNCSFRGIVEGYGYIGGLTGGNAFGKIQSSYATGSVTCLDINSILNHVVAGGLVGTNGGEISNCYAESKVYGRHFIGGISGRNSGVINNCYTSGNLKVKYGGLGRIAGDERGEVSTCYTNADGASGSGENGIFLGGDLMTHQSSFLGWDFENIWWIDEGNDYPRLWWEFTNTLPVADAGEDQTVFAFFDGDAEVQLDGIDSYDPDGDELEYYWYNDSNNLIATGAEPNVLLPVGEHVIDLIVNDGFEDSEPNSCVVTVIEPFETTAKMMPGIINLKSKRPSLRGRIEFAGETMPVLDPNEPMLLLIGDVMIEALEQKLVYSEENTMWYLTGSFESAVVTENLIGGTETEITLVSRFETGQWVYGRDVVRVK